jgi:O-antigen/teichoic acid export membrane protein
MKISPFKTFINHVSQFAGTSVLTQLLGFITFPILTRILTKEQYGILGLTSTTIMLAVALAKAGLSDGIIRMYKEYDGTQETRNLFASTALIRGVILALITTLIYLSIVPFFNKILNISSQYTVCFMVMALALFIRPLNLIVSNLLRVNGKIFFLNITGFLGKIVAIILSLFFFFYVFKGLYGYILGMVASEYILAIMLFSWFNKNYKVTLRNISGDLTVRLIKFGMPLLLTELSYLVLTYANRYMIVAYHGEDSLGLFSAGYNLAWYIYEMIMIPVTYAIIPIYVDIYAKEGKAKTEEFLSKCMHFVIIIAIPMCIGYYGISTDLFVTIASKKYAGAATFSPIILVGAFFLGIKNVLNAGLYLKKRSTMILIIMVATVLSNILCNILLIPKYNETGAAIATLISCIISSVLTVFLSYKYIFVSVKLKTVLYYLMLSLWMLFVINQINFSMAWLNVIVKITLGIVIFIPGVLWKEKGALSSLKTIFYAQKTSFFS